MGLRIRDVGEDTGMCLMSTEKGADGIATGLMSSGLILPERRVLPQAMQSWPLAPVLVSL